MIAASVLGGVRIKSGGCATGGKDVGVFMADVRMGIHRHYKGHLYQVLGVAHDANADGIFVRYQPGGAPQPIVDRKVVVYIGLELDAAHLGPRLAVRTLEDFTALVHENDGTPCTPDCPRSDRTGVVPRFEYLGPELTGDMLVAPDG